MENLTFLGLTKQHWDFINGFANWISAIGTVAAVIVSLYLATGATKPKARLSIGVRLIITPRQNGEHEEIVAAKLVNMGDRPIHITSLGWQVGFWKKSYAMQIVNATPFSQGVPVSLEYGKEAQWHIPTNVQEGWFRYFANGFLKNHALSTLKLVAYTSTGHRFTAKPEENLLSALKKAKTEVRES